LSLLKSAMSDITTLLATCPVPWVPFGLAARRKSSAVAELALALALAETLATRLRRRFQRALVICAGAALRTEAHWGKGRRVVLARADALAKLARLAPPKPNGSPMSKQTAMPR